MLGAVIALLIGAQDAGAIGWDSDDFLIGGGPSFTNKIGVFDHDLTFKGLLDPNFLTVGGMDFDSAGRLVAVGSALRALRVYDSAGAQVGGFVRPDTALGEPGDLKVAPNGTYIVGPRNRLGAIGGRRFNAQGDFVQQYGLQAVSAVAIVPGNQFWAGDLDSNVIRVFSIDSGVQTGTISVAGLTAVITMTYSASTNTVLVPDTLSSRIFETDLTGAIVQTFVAPSPTALGGVTRGPNGDVFATTSGNATILHWRANGDFVGATSTAASIGGVAGIVWAGVVPEPCLPTITILGVVASCVRRGRRGTLILRCARAFPKRNT
jgi:hypothetical protein